MGTCIIMIIIESTIKGKLNNHNSLFNGTQ